MAVPILQAEWFMDNRQEVVAIDLFYSLFPSPPPGSMLLTVHTADDEDLGTRPLWSTHLQYILQMMRTREWVLSLVYCSYVCVCLCLQWVLPEIIATSFIPVVLLISWHWFLFLLSAPLAGYLIHRLGAILPSSRTLVRPPFFICVLSYIPSCLTTWKSVFECAPLSISITPYFPLSHVFPPFFLPITRYVLLAPGSLGVYDATEIRNRGMLTNFTREAFIKIGYHLVMFFISLYW